MPSILCGDSVPYLQSLSAIRERCEAIFELGMAGKLGHFELNLSRLSEAADMIDKLIIRDFGEIDSEHVEQTLQKIPFGRWRHFGSENQKSLLSELGALDKMELTRSVLDLIVVSVLLDAGAGDDWRFNDNGKILMRSEGLAVATLRMFQGGKWSSAGKLQVDSIGLKSIQESDLVHWFQVRGDNPLLGLKGRLELLHRLGEVLERQSIYFPRDVNGSARPGSLVDHLLTRQCGKAQIRVNVLWDVVMKGFGGVWPESRTQLDGVSLGDVWPCAALGLLVPFHKLSQWLTYSLMERIAQLLGINFLEADTMTGLAEYRNGGLFIDLGILVPKQSSTLEPSPFSVLNQLVKVMSDTTARIKSDNPALSEWTVEEMTKRLEKSPFHKNLLSALEASSSGQKTESHNSATDEWTEYKNDGSGQDPRVLAPRDSKDPKVLTNAHRESSILGSTFPPESQVIIEWRALTVALMDRLIALMRKRLNVSPESFSFPKFFVAGSWKAGRELAKQLRPATGGPPISIESDAGAGRVQLEACDGRSVVVIRPRDAPNYTSKVVCVTGTVQPDNTISEGTVDEFGDNFSMSPPGGSDILDLANFAKFYFDFISPYSYLAFILLQRIAGPWELKIVYKPVRLPYIIKTTGNKPPASIPARAVFLKTDLMRSAQFYGIILRPPKDFLSISTKAPELVVHAAKMVVSGEDVGRIVKALWTEFFGKGDSSSFTSDPWSLKPLLDPLFPAETVESIITKAHEMDKTLRDTTDEALAAGAFGAPIMLITKDNQTEFFFGSDRFHHIAQFLDTDPRPLYTPQSKL